MSFQKVISVAGQSGVLSGNKSRMFVIDPWDPWDQAVTIYTEATLTEPVQLAHCDFTTGHNQTEKANMSPYYNFVGTSATGQTIVTGKQIGRAHV